MFITISSSSAPFFIASMASTIFTVVVLAPCGNPTTEPTFTVVPARTALALATWQLLTIHAAKPYFFASSQPAAISSIVASGRTRVWSIIWANRPASSNIVHNLMSVCPHQGRRQRAGPAVSNRLGVDERGRADLHGGVCYKKFIPPDQFLRAEPRFPGGHFSVPPEVWC